MRSEEHTKYLTSLSDKEKASLTSYQSFARRKNIIKKYRYRHLVNNEYPNDVAETERVLFYKCQFQYPSDSAWAEFGRIRAEYLWFTTRDVKIDHRSVPSRYHIHFIR